jgi:hypothetical protein
MLRGADGRAFDVQSAGLVDAEGRVEFSGLAADRWQLKMVIQPDTIKANARLMVETTCPLQPSIEIPLFVK